MCSSAAAPALNGAAPREAAGHSDWGARPGSPAALPWTDGGARRPLPPGGPCPRPGPPAGDPGPPAGCSVTRPDGQPPPLRPLPRVSASAARKRAACLPDKNKSDSLLPAAACPAARPAPALSEPGPRRSLPGAPGRPWILQQVPSPWKGALAGASRTAPRCWTALKWKITPCARAPRPWACCWVSGRGSGLRPKARRPARDCAACRSPGWRWGSGVSLPPGGRRTSLTDFGGMCVF